MRVYQRTRRRDDPVYHQRCLDLQTMWRIRHWAKDPESNSWVRHAENQTIEPSWRLRLHAWQDGRCYVCNKPSERMTIEHLVPRSRNGPTVKQNIVYSCTSCNYSRQHRMWGPEWKPDSVESTTSGFILSYSTIYSALSDAGLRVKKDIDGGFVISGPGDTTRKFYVLSTFACSERNPGSGNGRILMRLQNESAGSIVVFDYEWYARSAAITNMLRSKTGIAGTRTGARSLSLSEIDSATATDFLNTHHAMGAVNASHRIALTDGSRVIGLGMFADRGDVFECVRLAFSGHVAGGMSRIMTELRRRHGDKPISSYIDTRYADGAGHETIGFTHEGQTPETYMWVFPDRLQHQRYLSNDNKMSRNLIWFDPELSREENIAANGVFRVWTRPRLRMILR